jgi:hypothetical protein
MAGFGYIEVSSVHHMDAHTVHPLGLKTTVWIKGVLFLRFAACAFSPRWRLSKQPWPARLDVMRSRVRLDGYPSRAGVNGHGDRNVGCFSIIALRLVALIRYNTYYIPLCYADDWPGDSEVTFVVGTCTVFHQALNCQ